MWFANSEWIDGPMTAEYIREGNQVDLRYGNMRVLLSPQAALATLDNLRAALEAAGCAPVTIEVEDGSVEGAPQ